MKRCSECSRNIDGYCIEYNEDADKNDCDEFIDKGYAEWLCDLICPGPEDML